MIKPPAPPPPVQTKKLYCACGRYLGELKAPSGHVVVKCSRCDRWRQFAVNYTA
jgi:phage FluMu protein Com